MASRASPSSSSDVEDHDHDEVEEIGNVGDEQEDGQGGPLQKRRRISGEPFVLVRPRGMVSDSSELSSPGSSRGSSVTSRGSTSATYRTSSYPVQPPRHHKMGSVMSIAGGSGRGRSTSAEKDLLKSINYSRGGAKASSKGGGSSGRNMKEQWLVHTAAEQNRIRCNRHIEEQPSRWHEGGNRAVDDQITSSQGAEPAELARVQARLQQVEAERQAERREKEDILTTLQESVECPVCFAIPRAPPVPCCANGHVVCARCKDKVETCPTCRIPMTNCVNQVAATFIQLIQHPCEFKDVGCNHRCGINEIDGHEERCSYRLVRCPHWACDEMISLTNLTSHVIRRECGDNYMDKRLPYQEEIEYTRALDDQDGSSFWRPSLLMLKDITFYLQIEKCGKNRQWYFYVQMEGSSTECEKYETQITVCKNASSERNSISYCGKVCPIDIKGADELDLYGCGLNVRDAVMEKIFTVDNSTGQEGGKEGRNVTGEKEEGEVGDQAEEGEGDRYKFWVKVDIFEVAN